MNELITKIEGHGHLTIDWKKNKVRLNIVEGERLFEGLLVGRPAEEAPWLTSRICGVCPVAHNLASAGAVEQALAIKPDQTSRLLRELMLTGQIIQSHTLHLFFLVLPDYLGLDRATELARKNLPLFKKALALKEISDQIVQVVAGRSTHPTTTALGGFHKFPAKESLKKLLDGLEKTRLAAEKTISVFASFDYSQLKVALELAALKDDSILSVASGQANGVEPVKSLIRDYKDDIKEEVRAYSTAKFSKYKGKEVLVGALARLALREDCRSGLFNQLRTGLDFENPFHNIMAQAIEILIYHKRAQEIIKELLSRRFPGGRLNLLRDALPGRLNLLRGAVPATQQPSNPETRFGIGAVEAPRGMLFHEIHLNKQGLIKYANIITPTVQNLTSIEKSSQALLEQTKNRSRKDLERLLIMLVRAYDPCITCSVH